MTPLATEYRTIPLTQNQVATVSAHRLDGLMRRKWFAMWDPHTGTFRVVAKDRAEDGRRINIYLHREILGLKDGDRRKGDHINHDTLDNRDENLRIATDRQNALNRRNRSDNRSGYKGVSFYPPTNKWRARIMVDGKSKLLGYFATIEEACAARAKATKEFHGEFACIG